MTSERLTHLVRRHNAIQGCAGLFGLLGSALLWYASFWFFRQMALLWIYLLRLVEMLDRNFDGENISFYIAIGCTIVLAVEGFRRSQAVFDMLEFHDSEYNSGFFPARWGGGRGIPDPFASAWMISQFLFLAPRATLISVGALRSVIRAGPEAIDQAVFIFAQLEESRRWTSPAIFGECPQAIRLLLCLNLIWGDEREDEFKIRFPAGVSEADVEA